MPEKQQSQQPKDQNESQQEPVDAPEVPESDASETVEGGRYEVNGETVDANGEPLKGGK
jgi:hypothetical protein